MTTVAALVWKDLRLRARDKSALVIALIAPLALALVLSTAFSSFDRIGVSTVDLVDQDSGYAGRALIAALDSAQFRAVGRLRVVASPAAARRDLGSGAAAVALVVPRDYTESLFGPSPDDVTVLEQAGQPVASAVGELVGTEFVQTVNRDRLAVAAAVAAHSTLPTSALVQAVSRDQALAQLKDRQVGKHNVLALSYYGPAMGILFLFFTVSFGARSFLQERDEGVLQRLQAHGVSITRILGSKYIVSVLLGLVSMTVLWFVTSSLFGASWGPPAAVIPLMGATVLVVTALTGLVAVLTRSVERFNTVNALVAFGLCLLGGNFVPVSNAPTLIQQLSRLSPNGWTLRALSTLSTLGGSVASVAGDLALLVAFAVVVASGSSLLARWRFGS